MARVKVICRVRPPILTNADSICPTLRQLTPTTISLSNESQSQPTRTFTFTSVYSHSTSQSSIYDLEVASVIPMVRKGRNATVFVHGSSGSGKTFTMAGRGSGEHEGLAGRALKDLFAGGGEVSMSVSFMELKGERCLDLLGDKPIDLRLREREGVFFPSGLTDIDIASPAEFATLYDAASAQRSTASTRINDSSSRSHFITTITLSATTGGASKLTLIDLAGSESNKKSGSTYGSERMKEATEINTSLTALRKCIRALSARDKHINWRDCKLTKIMSSVLGSDVNGESVALLICNVAPEDGFYQETLDTLNFGAFTRKVSERIPLVSPIKRPASPVKVARAAGPSLPKASFISKIFGSRPTPPSSTPSIPPSLQTNPPPPSVFPRVLPIASTSRLPTPPAPSPSPSPPPPISVLDPQMAIMQEELRRLKERDAAREKELEDLRAIKGKHRASEESEGAESAALRKRLERVERLLDEAPSDNDVMMVSPIVRTAEEERQAKLRIAYLNKAHKAELASAKHPVAELSSTGRALQNQSLEAYISANKIRKTPTVKEKISVIREALDTRSHVEAVEKKRKTATKVRSNTAPPRGHGGMGGGMGKLAQGKRKGISIRTEPPIKRVKGDAARQLEVRLSKADGLRLEEKLLDLFNQGSSQLLIDNLKGVGVKRANAIIRQVDEEGTMGEFYDCNLTEAVLEKMKKDNVHLLELQIKQ